MSDIVERGNCVEIRERRMDFHRAGKVLFSGTPDLVRVWPKRGIAAITDFKMGRKEVQDIALNYQCRAYVVMLAEAIRDLDVIYACIIQPRVSGKAHVVEYTKADVIKARNEIHSIWDNSHQEDAARVAGHVQCAFCSAPLICEEHKKWLGAVTAASHLPVAQWTDEQMIRFEERRTALEKFIKTAHEQIKTIKAAQPGRLPGWELKDGAEVRTVVDLVEAYKLLTAAGLCTPEQFSTAAKLSLTDLQRIIWASRQGTPAQLTQDQVEEIVNNALKDVIVRKQNEPSLVKIKAKK